MQFYNNLHQCHHHQHQHHQWHLLNDESIIIAIVSVRFMTVIITTNISQSSFMRALLAADRPNKAVDKGCSSHCFLKEKTTGGASTRSNYGSTGLIQPSRPQHLVWHLASHICNASHISLLFNFCNVQLSFNFTLMYQILTFGYIL